MDSGFIYKIILKEDHINSWGSIFRAGWVGFTHLTSTSYFSIPIGMDEGFSVKKENCSWEKVPHFNYFNSIEGYKE